MKNIIQSCLGSIQQISGVLRFVSLMLKSQGRGKSDLHRDPDNPSHRSRLGTQSLAVTYMHVRFQRFTLHYFHKAFLRALTMYVSLVFLQVSPC